MTWKNALLLLPLLALSLSSVHAQIDVDIVDANTREPIDYINPDEPRMVDVLLTYDSKTVDFDELTLRTSELSPARTHEETYQYDNSVACERNGTTFTCPARAITGDFTNTKMRLDGDTSVTFTTTYGETEETHEVSFSTDNEPPVIESVESEYCEDGTCYVSGATPSTVTVDMSETPSGYSRGGITLEANGDTYLPVNNCKDNECAFILSEEACSGDTVDIVVSGEDDAGNNVEEVVTKTLQCEDAMPTLRSIEITPGEESRFDTFTNVGPISVNAVVEYDGDLPISMVLNGSDMNSGVERIECEARQTGDAFECSGEITPQVSESGTYDLRIDVQDGVGNAFTEYRSVDIQEVVEEVPDRLQGANGTVWEVSDVESEFSYLKAQNMVHDRRVPVTFSFDPANDAVSLADAEYTGTCTNTYGEGGNDIDSIDVQNIDSDQNEVDTIVTVRGVGQTQENKYAEVDQISYECELELYSKEDEVVYQVPSRSNVTFSLGMRSGDHISTNVIDELNGTQNHIEDIESHLQRLQYGVAALEGLCGVYQAGETGKGAYGSAHAALASANQALGGSLSGAVETSRQGLDTYDETTDKIGSRFKPVCEVLACQHDIQRAIPDAIGDGFGAAVGEMPDQVDEATSGEGWGGVLNPYESEYVAYGTACVPAITSHLMERRELQCQYQECLTKRVANQGVPSGLCSAQKAEAQCRRTVRNVEGLFPPTAIFNDFKGKLADVVANPEAALLSAADIGLERLCEQDPTGVAYGLCKAEEGVSRSNEMVQLVSDISRNVYGRMQSLRSGVGPRVGRGQGDGQRGRETQSICTGQQRLQNYLRLREDINQVQRVNLDDLEASDLQSLGPNSVIELGPVEQAVLLGTGEVLLSDKYYGRLSEDDDVDDLEDIAWHHVDNGKIVSEEEFKEEFEDLTEDEQEEIMRSVTEGNAEFNQMMDEAGDEVAEDLAATVDSVGEEKKRQTKLQKEVEEYKQAREQYNSIDCPNDDYQSECGLEKERARIKMREEQADVDEVEELGPEEADIEEMVKDAEIIPPESPPPGWGEMFNQFTADVRGYKTLSTTLSIMGVNTDFLGTDSFAENIREFDPIAEATCDGFVNSYAANSGNGVSLEGDTDVSSGDSIGTSSVYLTGMKAPVGEEFEYFITFGVNEPKQSLDFRVVLEGPGEKVVTDNLSSQGDVLTVPRDGRIGVSPNPGKVVSDENYERVCIEFLPDGSLDEYFDTVDALSGDRFCQRVVRE